MAERSVRIPRATYRLQLNGGFTFSDAIAVVGYLARLGISDLYLSPILRARPGSTHGYDIVDHGTINPELGGRAGFDALVAQAHAHRMRLLMDIVPNHMGVLTSENAWWMDVLEHGEASAYARFFDIDWHPMNGDLQGKVLVPLLGDHYGDVLERGELMLRFEAGSGSFAIGYFEHRLPLDPRETASLLRDAGSRQTGSRAGRDALERIAKGFASLPERRATAAGERAQLALTCKRELANLVPGDTAVAAAIAAVLVEMNAAKRRSRDALHALLERQAFRLAYWRVAADEINYRRFFDINELAALRMEDPFVFEATHATVLELTSSGKVDGLRLDHPDGLYDPGEYFARLQQAHARAMTARAAEPEPAAPRQAGPGVEGDATGKSLYVVVEKIGAAHERLPVDWAIHGTTGYRFGALVNGLFVDSEAKTRIDRTWRSFTGEHFTFDEAMRDGKRLVMRYALASELTVLASELLQIARADRRTRDFTFNTLRRALAEVAAFLPVYRTYLVSRPSTQDRKYVQWAIGRAASAGRAEDSTIFGFVRDVLLARAPAGSSATLRERVHRFARRFQQFTAPVAAKGVEDTAFYRFNRLVSLNEVGGDPDAFGISVSAFHHATTDRLAQWPHSLIATSTHDNKRSEDVRTRIDVLSELPALWRLLLRRWRRLNRSRRRSSPRAAPAPSLNDEYLLYQSLLGSCRTEDLDASPLESTAGATDASPRAAYIARLQDYMLKAAREAKDRTSWINPDQGYENALTGFVRDVLGGDGGTESVFVDELREQLPSFVWFGALNSLASVAIKSTAPGVPDFYRGCEFFDYSLVDPDNRRPVDFVRRAAALDALSVRVTRDGIRATADAIAMRADDDVAKLWISWRLLQLRASHEAVFRDGAYMPLGHAGAADVVDHLISYARTPAADAAGESVIVIAGRLFAKLLGEVGRLPAGLDVWRDARLLLEPLAEICPAARDGEWIDALSGRTVVARDGHLAVAEVLSSGFPAAVLMPVARPGSGRGDRSPG